MPAKLSKKLWVSPTKFLVVTHALAMAEWAIRVRQYFRPGLPAPSRCGIFLSRARLGKIGVDLGLRLPFGSRFEVARWFFEAAGEAERVEPLLAALEAEVEAWEQRYLTWRGDYPGWERWETAWLDRTRAGRQMLGEMRGVLNS